MDAPGALPGPLHGGAERPHGAAGVDHVLAFEQAADPRLPHGQSAQDQGAVGDRLVAGHADAAPEGSGAAGGERDLLIHGFFLPLVMRGS